MIIEFIGPSGAGKSTVAKQLVKKLNKNDYVALMEDNFFQKVSNSNKLAWFYHRMLASIAVFFKTFWIDLFCVFFSVYSPHFIDSIAIGFLEIF